MKPDSGESNKSNRIIPGSTLLCVDIFSSAGFVPTAAYAGKSVAGSLKVPQP